jgi:hypothetical protein
MRDVCAEKLNIETAVVHTNAAVSAHERWTQNEKNSMMVQGINAARAKCELRQRSSVCTRAENVNISEW